MALIAVAAALLEFCCTPLLLVSACTKWSAVMWSRRQCRVLSAWPRVSNLLPVSARARSI
jgi:hypothetical protein